MSVLLGYLHPNDLSASFHSSLLDLVQHDNGRHLAHRGAVRSAGYGLPEARNFLAAKCLELGTDWLLFIDADMGFKPDALDRLLEAADPDDRPIVGGLCFVWKDRGSDGYNGIRSEPAPTIYDFVDGNFKGRAHYPINAVIPVAATGTAMLLIHRTVLEKVRDKFGDEWFDRIDWPTGRLGEDISFFVRTNTLEIPAFVHTGVRTTHHKELHVAEWDFWQSFHAPPAADPVDVIVPTVKARADNLPQLAESLRASTGLARLWLVVDDDEHAAGCPGWAETIVEPGSFAHKINHAYKHIPKDAPWIKVVGDDCRFHPGWLDQAQLVARLYGAKVVGSNDLANPRVIAGEHATHWMIARDYIQETGASWDGPGVVAHEGYRHWFVDDEIVAAARSRGVFQVALGSVVEHFHPMVGKAEEDDTYRKNDRYASQDRDLFRKRATANLK